MADLGALKELCKQHNLLLVEDACQAIGGSYNGVPLGAIGDIGCFSFDYVKTITCGEGGGIITNNEAYYKSADHYSDHGHDHIGKDRGAEDHPFLGYNYRISELHAAVGLAQLQRLDHFIKIQKKHYTILKESLENVEGVTFRRVPEGGVENYSFLNFFLPDEESARRAHSALLSANIDGCFYWFNNNWHYHKKWDHLKNLTTLGPVSEKVTKQANKNKTAKFSQSDHWMGRSLSCLIKLSWSEEEVARRAKTMTEVLRDI
jgi:8-amino-3,8-dideoxy-alpha-D-manno-octulosonate transaminase